MAASDESVSEQVSESVSERKLSESERGLLVFFVVLLPSAQKRFVRTRLTRW